MSHQDFKEIVFSTKKPEPRAGSRIEISKLQKELLNDEDIPKLKTFGKENGKLLQSARLGKKLNQEQLGNQINERKNVINLYETGNVIPDNKILNKFRKILNVKFN
uniref:HTH cro/C1-type domain-containing protein n=1 Tax=Pyramimonas orientalis virus TaxID=455367 RepID=A0A7M3UP18_POV01|nr:hypothetical protein HWQ62_00337 [Pyramimonas orientalis virus]